MCALTTLWRLREFGPVMAVAREAADARAIPAHHQPRAVMLDFVDPERAGRWPRRLRRQARFDEPEGRREAPLRKSMTEG